MRQRMTLTLDDAKKILDAAQHEAESNDWAVAIAVVDLGGNLIALRRCDNAPLLSSQTAIGKAHSAVFGGKNTKDLEDMINNGRTAFLTVPEMQATMTGGVVIRADGWVAGAVGVSGVLPEHDAQIAQAGADALELP